MEIKEAEVDQEMQEEITDVDDLFEDLESLKD